MAIYFHWDKATEDIWRSAFDAAGTGTDLRFEGDLGNLDEIDYAVVWAPPPGRLKQFSNLKYIFSIGAGVTHITLDPEAPLSVPIVRLQDDMLVQDMCCHILHWVLHFHRHYHRYKLYEADRKWLRHKYPENGERKVAVLGLGQTGRAACEQLNNLGFDVIGWSQSAKDIPGIRCYHGDEMLTEVLSQAEILVNLLPLTPATSNLINAATLAAMPDGAFFINCGRGGTVVDADLLAALDGGKIEAAALDVFREEPLPEDDPYWSHPRVSVTPHAAAPSNERSAARFIAAQMRIAMDGGRPAPIMDLVKGY